LTKKANDLHKENEFYRSLIFEMVKDPVAVSKFEETVKDTLKTYASQANLDHSLKTIDLMSRMVGEKNNN
jgi:hypothetical protein